MPTCQNCHRKWTWKQTLKKSLTFKIGMTCPYCKEKQYLSTASRKKGSIYAVFPTSAFLFNIFFDISISTAFMIAVIIALIIIGVNPYFVELSNEEEPLF